MAHSRFIRDTGLTVRMTTVMFLLGAAFVGLIVALMYLFPEYALFFAVAGVGVAVYQWWSSDKVAMRAMRAREVTPEEAPELHGMIDRLCAMADMPKPRVGVADIGPAQRLRHRPVARPCRRCVTTGIMGLLSAEELEAVLAHELSHVAHRDVLVMTIAASAGIVAGLLTRGAQFGGLGLFGRRNNDGERRRSSSLFSSVLSSTPSASS